MTPPTLAARVRSRVAIARIVYPGLSSECAATRTMVGCFDARIARFRPTGMSAAGLSTSTMRGSRSASSRASSVVPSVDGPRASTSSRGPSTSCARVEAMARGRYSRSLSTGMTNETPDPGGTAGASRGARPGDIEPGSLRIFRSSHGAMSGRLVTVRRVTLVKDAKNAVALVRKAARGRKAYRAVTAAAKQQGPLERGRFQIAVYFADSDVNMYQMRQWYRPLQEIAKTWPVVVMARNAMGAKALLDDAELPVAFVPEVRGIERFLDRQDIRIVLYVNQNTRNFQMFRYGRRWHVFINHGESDKMYMTTNQYKAYDYALIAGQAARDRLTRTLWDFDLDRKTIEIGRPQADHYSGATPYEPDDRRVVLYAPTWEGDRPAAAYGSVASHGEALVGALLADPR